MRDYHNWDEERKMRFQKRMERHGRMSSAWTGFFLLLVGVAALIKATVTDFPDWIFSWQTFLIFLGFFVGVRHGFRGGTWLILMVIGGIFLVNEINPDLGFRRYLWPSILIAVGIIFILRPKRRWHLDDAEKKNLPGADSLSSETNYSNEDFVDSTSIFGGAKKNIISKTFKGGDIVNIFGGTELDLTQADFTGTAVIELTTVFGGTKLIIPSNWSIKSDAVIIFGGIEDKRKMQTINENAEKTLVIKGTVIFGGIDIKSY